MYPLAAVAVILPSFKILPVPSPLKVDLPSMKSLSEMFMVEATTPAALISAPRPKVTPLGLTRMT